MRKILSIDLDAFWSGNETIYVNTEKGKLPDFDWFMNRINELSYKKLVVGIDHHELCCELDNMNEPIQVINIDAHHDFYADDHFIWNLPLFYRSGRITIGNFFFHLLRERKIVEFKWLMPVGSSLEPAIGEVRRQVGPTYLKKIEIGYLNELDFNMLFDLVFISVSPEWIPTRDLSLILRFLGAFPFESNQLEKIKGRIQTRWYCGDDNSKINLDRFRFKPKSLK